MAELKPEFQVHVWRYTYAEASGGGTILLNSPQEHPDKKHDTLVLRQVNSDAENKVWIQDEASRFFRRTLQSVGMPLMDDAHGVIIRDGHTRTIPRKGEKAVTHGYSRGDRIWVDRRLVPTYNIDQHGCKIPVIDLESCRIFEIPFQYICFVPQLMKQDESNEYHITPAGSVVNAFRGQKKTKARIYFRWPVDNPANISYVWLDQKDKENTKEMKSFSKIKSLEHKQEAFRNQWQVLSKKLAGLGLLFGDEMVQGPVDVLDSSSDSEGEELALGWKTGSSAQKACCNLNPCPAFNNPDIDLVASYIGGYRWMEHYHVQDYDLDECPHGAEHQGHCVLRDNRTICAYATDRVRHTCCKLRMNPLLPGPHGDPSDITLPLWETTAADAYFVDVSRNIRTRMQLEDRDEIPPEMERLRQQMLKEVEVQPQHQNRVDSTDADMKDIFPEPSVEVDGTPQSQTSLLSSQQTLGSGDVLLTAQTTPNGYSVDQAYTNIVAQPFSEPMETSLYTLQPDPCVGYSAQMDAADSFHLTNPYTSQMMDPNQGPCPGKAP